MRISWRSELPQLLLIAGMFLAAALSWSDAPARVPVHWNAAGEVDRYGGRFGGLLLLPLLSLAVYALLLFLPRIDPGRASYPVFGTPYLVFRIGILVVLAAVYGLMHLAMRGSTLSIPALVAALVGVFLAVCGNFMGRLRPNWFLGVRTPWTLSSELAWVRTHRLAGWLFIAMGISFAAAGLSGSPALWALAVALVLGGSLFLVLYSYWVWRRDPDKVPPTGSAPAE